MWLAPPHPQYDVMADFRNLSVAGGSAPAERAASGEQAEAAGADAAAAATSQQDEVVGTGGRRKWEGKGQVTCGASFASCCMEQPAKD